MAPFPRTAVLAALGVLGDLDGAGRQELVASYWSFTAASWGRGVILFLESDGTVGEHLLLPSQGQLDTSVYPDGRGERSVPTQDYEHAFFTRHVLGER